MNLATSALSDLARRVDQLLDRYEVLRKENIVMRQHLLQAQAERDELRNRVDMAAARLEALKAQLPADA
ncbi:MAG: DUF904 domain-containing protein [Rhodocyclaceae bacterium]|nr:DUF904 domain-containing protein [Rhodocyclaceae bacterium]MBK6908669.1 DUF904 domain-containing protein [Rhodocyclaceae bacterium]